MANEVVKHHNDLNTIPMRNWSGEEMNFFFSILAKMRDQGTKVVDFTGSELKELADYSDWNLPRFKKIMENLGEHIASIRYYERTSHSFKIMNLFSLFEVNWNDDITSLSVRVGVTENYGYIINKLDAEFTGYELQEFTSIRSTYAKTVYRLLKQWKTKGKREFSISEFKALLDTPDYYGPSEIDKNVLKPVLRELPQFFLGLKIKKVKANTRGNPVQSYIFTWQAEKTEKWIDGKYDKKTVKSGKATRKEKIPEWAKEGYVPPEEKPLSAEEQAKFKQRLEQFRSKMESNKTQVK